MIFDHTEPDNAPTAADMVDNAHYYSPDGIAVSELNGTVTHYQKNVHGDVIAKTDDNGNIINKASEYYPYEAFGIRKAENDYAFGYCGEMWDSESGFVYLRNRMYDPRTGAFLTEDPAQSGTNWYSYCNANPVMFVDPLGLTIELPQIIDETDERFIALQMLTDDKLNVDLETGIVTYTKGEQIDREISTNLVREVIDNDILCKIETYEGNNGITDDVKDKKGNRLYIKVRYNPLYSPSQWSLTSEGGYGYITKPNFIVMGHELVHVWNRMNGEIDTKTNGYYLGGPMPGETILRKNNVEELNTVGVDYITMLFDTWQRTSQVKASEFRYSENAIRLEYDRVHKNDPNYSPLGRRMHI